MVFPLPSEHQLKFLCILFPGHKVMYVESGPCIVYCIDVRDPKSISQHYPLYKLGHNTQFYTPFLMSGQWDAQVFGLVFSGRATLSHPTPLPLVPFKKELFCSRSIFISGSTHQGERIKTIKFPLPSVIIFF